jgi:hypothetical protein
LLSSTTCQARKQKSEKIKSLGEPVELPGKALALEIDGAYAWVAENTAVIRKVELEVSPCYASVKIFA